MSHSYIACDLGAESGRVILGVLQSGILTLEEIHRFSNAPVRSGDSLHWDVHHIFEELKTGFSRVARHHEGAGAVSLSVDSWGVDYVLVNRANVPLSCPYHYRDTRTDEVYRTAFDTVPAEVVFAETGIQFMPINTLYQLLAHHQQAPVELDKSDQMLLIADFLHALFCGVGVAERSLASTTQLYNPITRQWSTELLSRFGLPSTLLPPLVDPGTALGPLLPEIASETGLSAEIQVIATCSHDTAEAVVAVPEEGDDWAFLSSGTWSLLGVELPDPLINTDVQAANFTNEIGYGGTVRFLKNIAGLWIIQECRREWMTAGIEYSYEELTALAGSAEPFRSLIDPADARFLKSGDMAGRVMQYCRDTGQPVPLTPGQVVRCALESLALSYRATLEQIEALTGRTIHRLHIVGGGSQSVLLNQFAANATGRKVLAGPVEATAIGNLLLQAVTLGHLETIADLRRTVRASFPIETFAPADAGVWQNAYTRFQQMETLNL